MKLNPNRTVEQRAARNKANKAYRSRNPGYASKKTKNKRKANPDKYRDKRLQKRYGITAEHWNLMFKTQNEACGICKRKQENPITDLAVDHCHTTGNVRMLLCRTCNQGIGLFKENPEWLREAANYLEGFTSLWT